MFPKAPGVVVKADIAAGQLILDGKRLSEVRWMLDFNVLTIFPEMFESFIGASILKRAIEAGLVRVENPRFSGVHAG